MAMEQKIKLFDTLIEYKKASETIGAWPNISHLEYLDRIRRELDQLMNILTGEVK